MRVQGFSIIPTALLALCAATADATTCKPQGDTAAECEHASRVCANTNDDVTAVRVELMGQDSISIYY